MFSSFLCFVCFFYLGGNLLWYLFDELVDRSDVLRRARLNYRRWRELQRGWLLSDKGQRVGKLINSKREWRRNRRRRCGCGSGCGWGGDRLGSIWNYGDLSSGWVSESRRRIHSHLVTRYGREQFCDVDFCVLQRRRSCFFKDMFNKQQEKQQTHHRQLQGSVCPTQIERGKGLRATKVFFLLVRPKLRRIYGIRTSFCSSFVGIGSSCTELVQLGSDGCSLSVFSFSFSFSGMACKKREGKIFSDSVCIYLGWLWIFLRRICLSLSVCPEAIAKAKAYCLARYYVHFFFGSFSAIILFEGKAGYTFVVELMERPKKPKGRAKDTLGESTSWCTPLCAGHCQRRDEFGWRRRGGSRQNRW